MEYDSAFELYIPNYNFSCNAVCSELFQFQYYHQSISVSQCYRQFQIFQSFLQVSFSHFSQIIISRVSSRVFRKFQSSIITISDIKIFLTCLSFRFSR